MINYLFELAIIHSALILGYSLFLRHEQAHTQLRVYLLGSTIFSLIIPLIKLPKLFPGSEQPILMTTTSPLPLDAAPIMTMAEIPAWHDNILVWIYLAGSLFFLSKCLWGMYQIIDLNRRGTAMQCGDLQVRTVPNIVGSFTFFRWIFLSKELGHDEEKYKIILKHEQAHRDLWHSFDLLFLELYRICFWWLPSAWFINREIKKIHEYQADAFALKSCGMDQYSSVLINTTLKIHGLSLASSFHDGLILKRIKAMKNSSNKMSPWRMRILISLSATLFLAFACTEEPDISTSLSPSQDDVFTLVEEHAEYPGGMDALYKYVAGEIRYPKTARSLGSEGEVWVQFVVERNGSVSDVKTVKGVGADCDREAVRVLQKAAAFKPAKQRGRTVRVHMMMPLTFKLNHDNANPDGSTQGSVIVGEANYVYGNLGLDVKYSGGAWTGTVTDEEGEPLPGANIVVVGTEKGTVSDLDGTFSIEAPKSQHVHVSFVGYETLELVEE